jgi:trimethylamine:corrinoid methyltransferase-like protein
LGAGGQLRGRRGHFDPGSSGVHILDADTLEHRPSYAPDLVRIIKIAEMLPQYDAQSTAVVCNEIPKEIGDLYRLFLVLMYSSKPIVMGVLGSTCNQSMWRSSRRARRRKPQAV